MMAPVYMRAAQISAAIESALDALDAPIDKIEIEGSLARVTAANTQLLLRCHLSQGVDGDGRPVLGSNSWTAHIVTSRRAPARTICARLLSAMVGRDRLPDR